MSIALQLPNFQDHPKSKLLTQMKIDILPSTKTLHEKKIENDTRIIPIYEVHRDKNNKNNILALSIITNNFHVLMETESMDYEVMEVEYEIFRQDQLFAMELAEKTKELMETDSGIELDDESVGNSVSPEEEMTSLRANELYNTIMEEWDNIVLGKKTGNFEKDTALEYQQKDYFSKTVYERAWEVHDIITTLIEGKYQPETLFGNYKEIYIRLNSQSGQQCARDLVRLARLMSRCVSPETITRSEEIIESIIPANANIKDAR